MNGLNGGRIAHSMNFLNNTDKLALMQVASYECSENQCTTCPYFAHVERPSEDFEGYCISIYLKQIVDKYYTERIEE